MTGFRTRFAPSPTGYLHLGHVASASYARAMAGPEGSFLIRIEDIDPQRCLPRFEQALREDLDWLGFESALPVRRQSDDLKTYRSELARLHTMGLVYRCACSRAQVQAGTKGRAPDGSAVYGGSCRTARIGADTPHVWRLDMQRALAAIGHAPGWEEWSPHGRRAVSSRAAEFGDVVLGRRDNGVSYHLCVTVDDARQKITLVTRGADLFEASSVHRVLQTLLGYEAPFYAHHGLICDESGQKLSKRDGAESLRALRDKGYDARQIMVLARASLPDAPVIPVGRNVDR